MVGSLRAVWPYLGADRGLQAPPAEANSLTELALVVGAFVFVTAAMAFARRQVGDEAVFGVPEDEAEATDTRPAFH